MTEQPTDLPDDARTHDGAHRHDGDAQASASARAAYERTRDGFGRALVTAAEEREGRAAVRGGRRRRRRIAVGGLALAGGLAALAIGITVPGGGDPAGSGDGSSGERPLAIGAAPAVAAVTAIRDAMHAGVLVRDAQTWSVHERSGRIQDWTDLQTRAQHVKAGGGATGPTEYWNPSAHERWSIDSPTFVAKDGRKVVSYMRFRGSANGSASESPVEEVERLLRDARTGSFTMRRGSRRGEQLLEASIACFSWKDGDVMECSESGRPSSHRGAHWPDAPPAGAEAVRGFQRWWISVGEQPRILRYDNGVTAPDGTDRRVRFRSVYREWEVLPRSAASLALVRPPAFDPSDYLVLRGNESVVSDAVRRGEVICTDERPGSCPR